jgi:hypothetical protein
MTTERKIEQLIAKSTATRAEDCKSGGRSRVQFPAIRRTSSCGASFNHAHDHTADCHRACRKSACFRGRRARECRFLALFPSLSQRSDASVVKAKPDRNPKEIGGHFSSLVDATKS